MTGGNHFKEAAATWDNPERIALLRGYAGKIKALVPGPGPLKILEVGCGTGILASNFVDGRNQVLGIDTSEEMLEVFRRKFPGDSLFRARLCNLEEQDLGESGFDLVISSMSFHHLRDPEAVLKKLRGLLAPSGRVAIVDLDEEDGSFHADPAKMGVHHFGFSQATLAAWAKAAGFQEFSREIIHTIVKDSGRYPIFLAVYS